jgi:heme-degrading monooxygenase HmoA
MHARSGAFRLSSDKVDDAISAFENDQLPRYKEQDGYKGFTLLADRDSGEVLGISFWEDEDALKGSDELGEAARGDIKERGEAEADPETKRWEVVVDDTA